MQISQLQTANRRDRARFNRSPPNCQHPSPKQRKYVSQNKESTQNMRMQPTWRKNTNFSIKNLPNSPGNSPQPRKKSSKVGRATSSKSPSKQRHPLIRSYIIKESKQEGLAGMILDCHAQHSNFICLLDSCINKRSLNTSTKLESNWKHNQHAKHSGREDLEKSFHNLRVKQSLKSVGISGLNSSESPKAKLTQKQNREMLRKSIKLSRNESQISSQVALQPSDKEVEYQSDYTQVTEYNSNLNMMPGRNRSSFLVSQDNKSFSNGQNYNSYLWNLKQKRLRQAGADKQVPSTRIKDKVNFSNSQLLDHHFKKKEKCQQVRKKMDHFDCLACSQNEYKKLTCKTCVSPPKKEEISCSRVQEELIILGHMASHSIGKRKISTHVGSPNKQVGKDSMEGKEGSEYCQKMEKIENPAERLESSINDELEEGSSCYLRTVNF